MVGFSCQSVEIRLNILSVRIRKQPLINVIFSPLALLIVGLGGPSVSFADVKAKPEPAPSAKTAALAPGEKLQEIQVTLFGQPCTMNGPFPKATLTLLHEISPEKIPPTASIEWMKRIRTKTTLLKNIPFPLEQYRDHLRKRLSAKIAFDEALVQAVKTNSANARKSLDAFLKNLKEHISTLQYPNFELKTKKLFELNAEVWNDFFTTPLRESYESFIQPDTEEEFHKSIRVSKIQYICSFDDGEHSSEKEEK